MNVTRSKGISAAVLKHVALLTMTIDHLTCFLLKDYLQGIGVVSLYSSTWYWLGRVIGRIAFVLYAFMIAEGAFKTHSKVKYAARLLVLAGISIVPASYAQIGKPFNPKDLNIFFLLFMGLVTIYAWDWIKERIPQNPLSLTVRFAILTASCAVSELTHMQYGLMGILLILVFHIYRNDFPKMAIAGALVMSVGYIGHSLVGTDVVRWFTIHSAHLVEDLLSLDRIQIFGLLAFPFLYYYNGEKGRQLSKWFYYLYYPVHLGVIALIMHL